MFLKHGHRRGTRRRGDCSSAMCRNNQPLIFESFFLPSLKKRKYLVHMYILVFVTFDIKSFFLPSVFVYTVAVSSWSIANNFRCLEILCQIAQSSLTNYFKSYCLLQFGIKSLGIYNIKAYVSQKILNWHSLRHSHSADF